MIIMVRRIESLSAHNALLKEKARLSDDRYQVIQNLKKERDELRADLKAAEDKINEWLVYSEGLTRLIGPKRRNDIPPIPKRLEANIPF